ncbi:hypothetical protein QE443_003289 [Pantoea ananatis]|nr:hypothetical protein [Pantoea ananatis]
MTVVAPFKLDDFIATGKTARQTNRAHGGFGAGVHHAHHFHAGNQFTNQLRHGDFHLGWCPEAQAALGSLNHGLTNAIIVMSQHHRAP